MRSRASEFEQFLLRANVIDLAVAVVIGAAFVVGGVLPPRPPKTRLP